MRFWKRREADFDEYEYPKGKRQPQTLKSVAEKILARKMKQDPEYGLQIAEKLLKVAPPEPRSLQDMLHELGETKEILNELAGSGQQTGSGLIHTITELASTPLGQTLAGMVGNAAAQLQAQGGPQITQMPAPTQLQPPPAPDQPPQPTIELADFFAVSEMQVPEAYENLPPLWKQQLAPLNYNDFLGLMHPFIDDPVWNSMVAAILSQERKKWVTQLLRLCSEGAKGG